MVLLAAIGARKIVFFDALGQIDVSSEYSSILPWLRYVIEPFAIIAFIFEYEFTWLLLLLVVYPIIRVIYIFLRKKGRLYSEKYNQIRHVLIDIIYFIFKVFSITLVIILLIILIGYLFQGFFFVSRYFMVPIQIGIHLCYILIGIKVGYTLLKLIHPRLKLNLTSKIENNIRRASSKKTRISYNFRKESVIFAGIIFLLLGTNIVLISIQFPPHKIIPTTPLEDDEFLFDFHVHTTFSDGWLTPEERVIWYMEQGITGAAFSDHENLRGARSAREFVEKNGLDFTVWIAEEWTNHETSPEIHMNYYGLEEEIVPPESYTPGGPKVMNASELITYVKANGGFITVNHYHYEPNPEGGFGTPYTLDQLRVWGIDGFEIINGGSYNKYTEIREFCLNNSLICIAASDIHTNEDLNTFIKLKLDDPNNKTIANIFKNLRNNTHEAVAIQFYPEIVEFPGELTDLGLYVLEDFINYFLNIDTYQALSWIIWSSSIYAIFVLFYKKIKKVEIKHLKLKIS
ncbi:MAG: PHP domain-containing protein [Candidatus Hermodarchaeota archaeon]